MISAYNVIKKFAFKAEETSVPEGVNPQTAPQGVPQASTENRGATPDTKRFFYFRTKEAIPYSNLLKEAKMNPAILEKLKSESLAGQAVGARGDNFIWTHVLVKTNEFSNNVGKNTYVIYSNDLTTNGGKTSNIKVYDANGQEILTNYMNLSKDQIVKEIEKNIYKDGVKINLEGDDIFMDRDFNPNDIKLVRANTLNGLKGTDGLKNKYSPANYRLWDKNKLVSPNFEENKEDNFLGKAGVAFIGTDDQIKALEQTVSSAPEGAITVQQPQSTVPTGTNTNLQPKIPKSVQNPVGQIIKQATESNIILVKEDESDIPTYTGDTSILQDLVKLQHRRMKLRKESSVEMTRTRSDLQQQQATRTTKSMNPVTDIDKAQKDLSNQSTSINKVIDEAKKALAKAKQQQQKATQQTQQSGGMNLNVTSLPNTQGLFQNKSAATPATAPTTPDTPSTIDDLSDTLDTVEQANKQTIDEANSALEQSKRKINPIYNPSVSQTGRTFTVSGPGGYIPPSSEKGTEPSQPMEASVVIDLFLRQ